MLSSQEHVGCTKEPVMPEEGRVSRKVVTEGLSNLQFISKQDRLGTQHRNSDLWNMGTIPITLQQYKPNQNLGATALTTFWFGKPRQ